jgi:hypothetical protein
MGVVRKGISPEDKLFLERSGDVMKLVVEDCNRKLRPFASVERKTAKIRARGEAAQKAHMADWQAVALRMGLDVDKVKPAYDAAGKALAFDVLEPEDAPKKPKKGDDIPEQTGKALAEKPPKVERPLDDKPKFEVLEGGEPKAETATPEAPKPEEKK